MSREAEITATLKGEAGFTLAELLAAFALLGLVMAGVGMLQQAAQQSYMTGSAKTLVDQSARIALERLASEIRGTTAVTAATATSITLTIAGAAVVYTIAANTLTRNGVAVVGGLSTLTFAYFDAAGAAIGAPVGTPVNIRRVDITVQTQSENALIGGGGTVYDVRSQIMTSARLRNL